MTTPTPQPVWITPAGTLGTIPEGIYYSVPVVALDPDPTIIVNYEVVSGALPKGMTCTPKGVIFGIPVAVEKINGVETSVPYDVTSRFTIRAYTYTFINGIRTVTSLIDRSFSFTVTSNYIPQFITPAGSLGSFAEGTLVSEQIDFLNPTTAVVATINSGSLPPGLTMNASGLITGVVNVPVGTYTFTVKLANGEAQNLRTFSMITTPVLVTTPVMITPEGSIGVIRSDTVFSYQFSAENVDGTAFQYTATTALPPGLTLDPNSGWLYGTVPSAGIVDTVFDFSIQLVAGATTSPVYNYSLEVVSSVNTLTWLNGPDLGLIVNGDTSTLFVKAVSSGGQTLTYSLDSDSVNSLPQGLALLSDGTIAGRVSFDTFALDDGYTTFDQVTTTFDMSHTFTVHVTSADGAISAYRTFTVTVDRVYNLPYNNLYIQATPGFESRAIISSLITDSQIFDPSLIYRPLDPNFGVATGVNYWHCFGLNPVTQENYFAALARNHFWRNVTLGQFKTARALDAAGNTLYEVVYSEIIDDQVGDQITYTKIRLTADITTVTADNIIYTVDSYDVIMMSKALTLPYEVTDYSGNNTLLVYPDSLVDMRDRVIDTVGQRSDMLPRWMMSTQADGNVLGFTPAWVVAYTVPGAAERVAYNISQYFESSINQVDFKVDRYELDNALTYNWDVDTSSWMDTNDSFVTFDNVPHYQNTVVTVPATAGTGYAVGDQIRILGSQFGWLDGANDCVMTVFSVDGVGGITGVFCWGFAQLNSAGDTFTGLVGTNITGTGTGTTWDITVTGGVLTSFDNSETQFSAPADRYLGADWDQYNRYIVFQNETILGTKLPTE